MIVTVTVNPAVDYTLWVRQLELGCVNRPHDTQIDPAGKGVNVSRMAHRLGWPTMAFGFTGGEAGHMVERALRAERVQHHFVHIAGETRINVTINDERIGTSFYAVGPHVEPGALVELDEMLESWLPACRVLVLAGSLLPGMSDAYYAELTRRACQRGVKVFVDADGECGRHAIAARPWLYKPNVLEAERLLGRRLADAAAVLDGAREIARRGVEVVLLSMGAEGAICVSGDRAWRVRAPDVERKSTVGSGDSLVAGVAVAVARGEDLEAGLRLGTAAGAATAMSPGTALGALDDILKLVDRVVVETL
jgi:1-phosphofructokinase family hexose kinase